MNRFVAVNLDALGPVLMRKYEMDNVKRLYNNNGELLGISSFPHTAFSMPLIHSGEYNRNPKKAWVKVTDESSKTWVDPARHFNRDVGESTTPNTRTWKREEFEHPFIWDYAKENDYDTTVFKLPIVLPPFSMNSPHDEELGDYWFPDSEERIRGHQNKKPELILKYLEEGTEALFSSIQTPDKIQHLKSHQRIDEFAQEMFNELDEWVGRFHEFCEDNNITYLLYGDHGTPHPGAAVLHDIHFNIPRHRKESVVFTNADRKPPKYSKDMFNWMVDVMDLDLDVEVKIPDKKEFKDAESNLSENENKEVTDRLRNLGYL